MEDGEREERGSCQPGRKMSRPDRDTRCLPELRDAECERSLWTLGAGTDSKAAETSDLREESR